MSSKRQKINLSFTLKIRLFNIHKELKITVYEIILIKFKIKRAHAFIFMSW